MSNPLTHFIWSKPVKKKVKWKNCEESHATDLYKDYYAKNHSPHKTKRGRDYEDYTEYENEKVNTDDS